MRLYYNAVQQIIITRNTFVAYNTYVSVVYTVIEDTVLVAFGEMVAKCLTLTNARHVAKILAIFQTHYDQNGNSNIKTRN